LIWVDSQGLQESSESTWVTVTVSGGTIVSGVIDEINTNKNKITIKTDKGTTTVMRKYITNIAYDVLVAGVLPPPRQAQQSTDYDSGMINSSYIPTAGLGVNALENEEMWMYQWARRAVVTGNLNDPGIHYFERLVWHGITGAGEDFIEDWTAFMMERNEIYECAEKYLKNIMTDIIHSGEPFGIKTIHFTTPCRLDELRSMRWTLYNANPYVEFEVSVSWECSHTDYSFSFEMKGVWNDIGDLHPAAYFPEDLITLYLSSRLPRAAPFLIKIYFDLGNFKWTYDYTKLRLEHRVRDGWPHKTVIHRCANKR
jgi:hypothetical protein